MGAVEFLTAREWGQLYGIGETRARVLLSEGRVEGAQKIDGIWTIPDTAPDPRHRDEEGNIRYGAPKGKSLKVRTAILKRRARA